MGAMAVPLMMTAASAAMQYMAQSDAQSKRQGIINQMQQATSAANQRNIGINTDVAKQYDPTARAATLDQIAGTKTQQLNDALDQAHKLLPSSTAPGNVPTDYKTDEATKFSAEKQRELNLTKMLGAMMAPGQLRANEGYNLADAATRSATNASNLRGSLAGSEYDVGKVQADPLLTVGGQVVGGVGSGMAANAYGDQLRKLYSGMFAPTAAPATLG